MKRIVVVGGGIAGLTAAYRLQASARAQKLDLSVTLLESSPRLGGKILTERAEQSILEGGPDSFTTIKPTALELIRELGLGTRLLPTQRDNTDVFVYARGRLRRMPEGLFLMAPAKIVPFLRSDLMSWAGKCRMALDFVLPARKDAGDESMADFALRRFGREALETIVQPVMGGIYAGNAEELSLKSTFPKFMELERQFGSVIRGLRKGAARSAASKQASGKSEITAFMSLTGGLQELVDAISSRLDSGVVRLGARVSAVRADGSQYRVELESGTPVPSDAVILGAPAWSAADMLDSLDAGLSSELRQIPFVSSATISFLFTREETRRLPAGFGFVVRRGESRCVSAATFTSTKFPSRVEPGKMLLRCFLGGAGRETLLDSGNEELAALALADLKAIAGLEARPLLTRIYRWPRANPQYLVGHGERLLRIRSLLSRHPGLWLSGASYNGVGLPDCIASGSEAAQACLQYLFG